MIEEEERRIKEKKKEIEEKKKEIEEKKKKINYKERIYLYPSFELDSIIFELLNDNYKEEFQKNMEILKQGLSEVNDEKIDKGSDNIIKLASQIIDKIKK